VVIIYDRNMKDTRATKIRLLYLIHEGYTCYKDTAPIPDT